jgi:hypothetical protein
MRILFLDIETSPNLTWTFDLRNAFISIDQIVEPTRMICWAAKWYGEKKTFFRSEYHDDRGLMLEHLCQLLDEADAVVHFNGKRFDIPKINGEFYTAGMKPPSPYQQIDLWVTASRKFGFPSSKLAYILKASKLQGKLETGGFKLWADCLAGDAKAWAKMKRYNIQDVKAMEPLYDEMLPWISGHPNMALETGKHCCPSCGSENVQKRGFHVTHVSRFQRYQCQDCGSWSRAARREEGTGIQGVSA